MSERLGIRVFGGLSVRRGEAAVTAFDQRKAAALLVYLACTRREHPRETLAEFFWEERAQAQSLANLRVALTGLRQAVGDFVDISREAVGMSAEADWWLDARAFEEHLAAGRLSDAVDLYRGDFLEGFTVDSGAFEEWAARERERLRLAMMAALDGLIVGHLAAGEYALGIARATRLLQMDGLREEMGLIRFSGGKTVGGLH